MIIYRLFEFFFIYLLFETLTIYNKIYRLFKLTLTFFSNELKIIYVYLAEVIVYLLIQEKHFILNSKV